MNLLCKDAVKYVQYMQFTHVHPPNPTPLRMWICGVLQLLRISRPSGCIVWMHDASIVGDVDEQILVGRHANWIQLVWLHALGLLGGLELILPICRLHESLPDVQLIIRRLPPRQEASLAVLLVASWEWQPWNDGQFRRISPSEPCCKGKSFGRMLLDEITEQLSKAGQYLLLRCQLNVKRRSVQIFLDTFDSMKTGPLTTHVKPKVHATSPCEASESWPLSKVILGGFGAGGTAALLGLLFPQLGGLVYLGSKVGKLGILMAFRLSLQKDRLTLLLDHLTVRQEVM